jgi:hypothetical protein
MRSLRAMIRKEFIHLSRNANVVAFTIGSRSAATGRVGPADDVFTAMRGFTPKAAGVADHAIGFLPVTGFTVILSSLSLASFRKQST